MRCVVVVRARAVEPLMSLRRAPGVGCSGRSFLSTSKATSSFGVPPVWFSSSVKTAPNAAWGVVCTAF